MSLVRLVSSASFCKMTHYPASSPVYRVTPSSAPCRICTCAKPTAHCFEGRERTAPYSCWGEPPAGSIIANAALVLDVAHTRGGVADSVVKVVRFESRQALKHKRDYADEESGLVSYASDICRMAPDLPRQTVSEQLRTDY